MSKSGNSNSSKSRSLPAIYKSLACDLMVLESSKSQNSNPPLVAWVPWSHWLTDQSWSMMLLCRYCPLTAYSWWVTLTAGFGESHFTTVYNLYRSPLPNLSQHKANIEFTRKMHLHDLKPTTVFSDESVPLDFTYFTQDPICGTARNSWRTAKINTASPGCNYQLERPQVQWWRKLQSEHLFAKKNITFL